MSNLKASIYVKHARLLAAWALLKSLGLDLKWLRKLAVTITTKESTRHG
ncbi:MAG: hypothetical protein LKF36_05560 [Lactobacillus sp.]|jgi:hypothetical protein|nr:hypothetical protein [Lactobacillus sp.]